MTALGGSENRMIIPRWRMWKITRWSGEVAALSHRGEQRSVMPVPDIERDDEISRRIASFFHSPGVHSASDALATALILDRMDHAGVDSAAEYILREPASPMSVRRLAERVLGLSEESAPFDSQPHLSQEGARSRATALRIAVHSEPRNAIGWADLSHAQTTLGTSAAAIKSMRIALALAPENRFILRAATRLHLQHDDFEQAHDLLKNTPSRLDDPWVLAAEIATAQLANRPIRNMRRGKKLLESDLSPWHISELASALAALELQAGKTKQARKLLKIALEDPTENALAQAEWSAQHGIDIVTPEQLQIPQGFEARALYAHRIGDFATSIDQAKLWQADQPFALAPAIHISYVAALLVADYETAIQACQVGLITNPDEPMLLNNMAFSLACMGQPVEATAILDRSPNSGNNDSRAASIATRGLIAYRLGDPGLGYTKYLEAIQLFKRQGNTTAATASTIMWAGEEIRIRGQHSAAALKLARQTLTEKNNEPEVAAMENRFKKITTERWRE